MKKQMYWIIFGLVLIIINLSVIPISVFSLFGTEEGTSIFSLDYLIAFTILFIPNIITISLLVSAKKKNLIEFFIGVGLAIGQSVVLMCVLFGMVESPMLVVGVIGLCAVGGIILIVKSICVPSTKSEN